MTSPIGRPQPLWNSWIHSSALLPGVTLSWASETLLGSRLPPFCPPLPLQAGLLVDPLPSPPQSEVLYPFSSSFYHINLNTFWFFVSSSDFCSGKEMFVARPKQMAPLTQDVKSELISHPCSLYLSFLDLHCCYTILPGTHSQYLKFICWYFFVLKQLPPLPPLDQSIPSSIWPPLPSSLALWWSSAPSALPVFSNAIASWLCPGSLSPPIKSIPHICMADKSP